MNCRDFENILFLHLRYVSYSTKVSGLSLESCSPLLGQNPYMVSVSKLAVVAHQRYPSFRPSVVHESYFTPWNTKGKTHGASLLFPSNVKRTVGKQRWNVRHARRINTCACWNTVTLIPHIMGKGVILNVCFGIKALLKKNYWNTYAHWDRSQISCPCRSLQWLRTRGDHLCGPRWCRRSRMFPQTGRGSDTLHHLHYHSGFGWLKETHQCHCPIHKFIYKWNI